MDDRIRHLGDVVGEAAIQKWLMLAVGILSGMVLVFLWKNPSPRKAPPCAYIKKVCKAAGYTDAKEVRLCVLQILNSGTLDEKKIDDNIVAKCKIRLEKKRSKSSKSK